jgi:hypothetical protein
MRLPGTLTREIASRSDRLKVMSLTTTRASEVTGERAFTPRSISSLPIDCRRPLQFSVRRKAAAVATDQRPSPPELM